MHARFGLLNSSFPFSFPIPIPYIVPKCLGSKKEAKENVRKHISAHWFPQIAWFAFTSSTDYSTLFLSLSSHFSSKKSVFVAVSPPPSPSPARDCSRMTDELEAQINSGHVARRSKLDELLQSVAIGATPRSNSWSREQQDMSTQLTQSARSPRSKASGAICLISRVLVLPSPILTSDFLPPFLASYYSNYKHAHFGFFEAVTPKFSGFSRKLLANYVKKPTMFFWFSNWAELLLWISVLFTLLANSSWSKWRGNKIQSFSPFCTQIDAHAHAFWATLKEGCGRKANVVFLLFFSHKFGEYGS